MLGQWQVHGQWQMPGQHEGPGQQKMLGKPQMPGQHKRPGHHQQGLSEGQQQPLQSTTAVCTAAVGSGWLSDLAQLGRNEALKAADIVSDNLSVTPEQLLVSTDADTPVEVGSSVKVSDKLWPLWTHSP